MRFAKLRCRLGSVVVPIELLLSRDSMRVWMACMFDSGWLILTFLQVCQVTFQHTVEDKKVSSVAVKGLRTKDTDSSTIEEGCKLKMLSV